MRNIFEEYENKKKQKIHVIEVHDELTRAFVLSSYAQHMMKLQQEFQSELSEYIEQEDAVGSGEDVVMTYHDESRGFCKLLPRETGVGFYKLDKSFDVSKYIIPDLKGPVDAKVVTDCIRDLMAYSLSAHTLVFDHESFAKSKTGPFLVSFIREIYSRQSTGSVHPVNATPMPKHISHNYSIRTNNTNGSLNFSGMSSLLILTDNSKYFDILKDNINIVKRGDADYFEILLMQLKDRVGVELSSRAQAQYCSLSDGARAKLLVEIIGLKKSREQDGKLLKLSEIHKMIHDMFNDSTKDDSILTEIKSVDADSIGGYDEVKRFINDNIISILKNEERAKQFNIKYNKGMIFYGFPGVGKTTFVQSLGASLELPVYKFDISKVLNKFVGESESRLSTLITLIERLSPCVLFIDEIDSVTRTRTDSNLDSGVGRNMINILLQYISDPNRKSIIVGATNRIQDIDPAITRSGRLGTVVYIPVPNVSERWGIFKSIISSKGYNLTDVDIDELAKLTHNFTGGDIEEVINSSAIYDFMTCSLNELRKETVISKIKAFRMPSNREDLIKEYNQCAEQYCTFLPTLEEKKIKKPRQSVTRADSIV